MTDDWDSRRRRAGRRASEFATSGMAVGLGTGRTADHATRALAERIAAGLRIVGVPTSQHTADLAKSLGIPLATLEERPRLDLAIDGADQVDPQLQLIKGHGGALLREKIVAAASARLIIVVDDSKLVDRLGHGCAVPVEVLPFGWRPAAARIEALGAAVSLRGGRNKPDVTDNGNSVLDCQFGSIASPESLDRQLSAIPGVLGTGLFVGMADTVIVGTPDGVELRSAG